MASEKRDVKRPAYAVAQTWLLLLTTYSVIVAGAMLLAVAERTIAYLFTAIAFCAAHALVVGPQGSGYLSDREGKVLAVGALAFALLQVYASDVHISFAAAHFLILVQLIKLYGPRWRRDLRLIQVATIFEVVVASIWAVDFIYLPVFVLATLCIMANLMALVVHPPSRSSSTLAQRSTAPVALIGWKDFGAALWLPAAAVFVGTVFFFALLPRFHSYRRVRTTTSQLVTGFSNNVSLREVGMLRQSNRIAFRAKFFAADLPDMPPTRPTRVLMRGLSFPVYRDGQWFGYGAPWQKMPDSLEAARQAEDYFASRAVYFLRDVDVRRRLILQEVTPESPPAGVLFALYRPRELRGTYERTVYGISHHLVAPRASSKRTPYAVLSMVPEFSAQQLREAETPPPSAPWYGFRALPEDIVPALRKAAAEIEHIYSPQTDYDRVIAAQRYLVNPQRFTYTYKLPEYGNEEPIVDFLTRTRRGSCEQFATALAMIVRTWDIPTRLAIGFKGGEFNERTQSYIFRDRDAHAWVEVHFNGLGWVEFDPTPDTADTGPASEQPGALGAFLARLKSTIFRAYQDTRAQWGGNVVGYSRDQQQSALHALARTAASLAEGATGIFRAVWPAMPDLGLLQVALLAVCFTFLAMAFYLLGRRMHAMIRRLRPGRRADRTLRFYENLLAVLRKKGLRRPAHSTAREFARDAALQLVRTNDDDQQVSTALNLITDLYYRARFGRQQLSEQQQKQVHEALRTLRRTRRSRATAKP